MYIIIIIVKYMNKICFEKILILIYEEVINIVKKLCIKYIREIKILCIYSATFKYNIRNFL